MPPSSRELAYCEESSCQADLALRHFQGSCERLMLTTGGAIVQT